MMWMLLNKLFGWHYALVRFDGRFDRVRRIYRVQGRWMGARDHSTEYFFIEDDGSFSGDRLLEATILTTHVKPKAKQLKLLTHNK